jgi:arylsulfatase A-like enzyme
MAVVAAMWIAILIAMPLSAQNVIVISVDTLRSDHLPAYGYSAISTPNLDRFRRDSVLYARAWTHCPLTLPSHATILTGQLPVTNGIRDNTGFVLRPSVKTVAERLAPRYESAAFVSTHVLRKKTNVFRGFARTDVPDANRDGSITTQAALDWLSSRKRTPFFLLLHLYEPHYPYEPSYDGEIERVDQILGTFFQKLRALRLYDSSLILFLSDHGEGLRDHGEREHGVFLYREALQVPLIVKFPSNRYAGERVEADAALIDVLPTILAFARVPASGLPGIPLDRLRTSTARSRVVTSETLYPNLQLEWNALRSVISGDRHLIAGRRVELFDLAKDPRETTNVADAQRRTVASLRALLPALNPASPSSADTEDLTSLGYLSGGHGATGLLPDPAERIAIYPDMFQLFVALRRQQYIEALARAEKILEVHPEFPEVWEKKALALYGLDRAREAKDAWREAARRRSR